MYPGAAGPAGPVVAEAGLAAAAGEALADLGAVVLGEEEPVANGDSRIPPEALRSV